MKSRKEEILVLLQKNETGLTAGAVAEQLMIDRSNASRYLNELYSAYTSSFYISITFLANQKQTELPIRTDNHAVPPVLFLIFILYKKMSDFFKISAKK